MKVGQVTFFRIPNYGGTLQAYALNYILNKKYYECEIIDYPGLNQNIKKTIKEKINGIPRDFKNIIYVKKYLNFQRFIEDNFRVSKKVKSYDEVKQIAKNYDMFVCGSDQIWNNEMTGGKLDPFFFLEFEKDKPKIAYAPSLGKVYVEKQFEKEFEGYISNFKKISVREKSSVENIQKYTNKKIDSVIDPTLLLTAIEWSSISKRPKISEKYVLVYDLAATDEFTNTVNYLSKILGLKVIHFRMKKLYDNELKKAYSVGPSEFLGLFENAEFIITNSFHGTVFSIINKKKFYTLPINKTSSRMKDLLSELNLEDRYINSIESIDVEKEIDYLNVEILLNKKRNEAFKFLDNIIKK